MKRPTYSELISALQSIALLGGNLSDADLTDRTGANDAVARGLMYTSARTIAAKKLISAGYRLSEHGTEWVKDK